MAKEKGRRLVAQNRKARHDYHIHDTYEAGIVLSGTEVKSLREGRANLTDAFATVDEGEVWLRAAHIPEYTHGTWTNHTARPTPAYAADDLIEKFDIRYVVNPSGVLNVTETIVWRFGDNSGRHGIERYF